MEIPSLDFPINREKWSYPIDITDENLTTEDINGYLAYYTTVYQRHKYQGKELWNYFHEDFEEWTIEIFTLAHRQAVRNLATYLKTHNVWMKDIKGISYAKVLQICLEEETPHKLTEGPVLSTQLSQPQSPSPLPPPSVSFPDHRDQLLPLSPIQTDPANVPAKHLTDLMKVYYNDDKKYGGEEYDILDTKLQILYDCCFKIGLPKAQYHYAYSIMLKGRASTFYYDKLAGRQYDFQTMITLTRAHFETEENHQKYLSEWRETTLARTILENSSKTKLECLQLMIDKLQKIQQGLNKEYHNEYNLRDQVINACRGVKECNLVLYKPASTFEGVCAELRSAIGTALRSREPLQTTYQADAGQEEEQYWTDRTYGGRNQRGRGGYRGNNTYRGNYRDNTSSRGGYQRSQRFQQKRCYVCNQPGCWSTKHTIEERKIAYEKFKQQASYTSEQEITSQQFGSFLAQYEGLEGIDDDDKDQAIDQFMAMTIDDNNNDPFDTYLTELGQIDGQQTIAILNNQSAYHAFTRDDIFQLLPKDPLSATFTFSDRYSSEEFQGIMPDSGAAGISSAGEPQLQALQRKDPSIKLDVNYSGNNSIKFGKGTAIVKGTVQIPTPLGVITFYIVPTNTPFLLCLQDMDKLGVQFDNLQNVLIQGKKIIPIVRKWGHPWMLLDQLEKTLAWSHLTEVELRQLHRRFGHPSVQRLAKVLQRAGHDPNTETIRKLTKFCHQCQMHGKSPGRFKFTLKDDIEFNYSVVVDILYIDSKPVLQAIDSATAFGAARFLKDISSKTTWDTLRLCWIDVYLGPPDFIVHDAGKNFISTEFKQLARTMAIETKGVPIEAHNSVGLVERYHTPLRRSYEIIKEELKDELVDNEMILQMAVKTVNDSAGPDGLVPTLLVFGAYPRLTELGPPSPSIAKRAEAIRVAMKEVRRLHAKRQVQDALAVRNGPSTRATLDLPLQSEVRVWREKEKWTGPYRLLAIEGETCTIDMPRGPAKFRSTVVKPYHRQEEPEGEAIPTNSSDSEKEALEETAAEPIRRKRGRPKGSKNVRRSEASGNNFNLEAYSTTFLTRKEQSDKELALDLRRKGIINTPGNPFQESQRQEIEGLVAKGVFEFVQFDPQKHSGVRVFNSRLVNEVKGKATNTPYEKSRLVIQAYNDEGKELILTQSPTIQRASQRLIMAIAPSLARLNIKLFLRDITQAYIQSTTLLNRLILANLPKEMQSQYPPNTIMIVKKPLYGIPEAGTHWWATYYRHHKDKLAMVTSSYDPCLLITTNKNAFGVVGMQTDDTLFLGSTNFATLEDNELQKAKLTAKPRDELSPDSELMFNGCILAQTPSGTLTLKQKGQGKKLQLIELKEASFKQQYVEQRARGAYVASICQPEASYDLSIAAQHQDPTEEDAKLLNKRIQWQIDNQDRGIDYMALDLTSTKLFVFVDGSFANNKDLSSQIGYLTILANENSQEETFQINGNLIHYSSTKSKRVTRSVLASEIYGMVGGVDIAIAISTTLKMITDQLDIPQTSVVVCTDSYSLYECLVKLGTTKEKRLMIDIMALRQSYERREIMEIRWIDGKDNPADAMTKSTPNKALEKFLSTGQLKVRVEGWVQRKELED